MPREKSYHKRNNMHCVYYIHIEIMITRIATKTSLKCDSVEWDEKKTHSSRYSFFSITFLFSIATANYLLVAKSSTFSAQKIDHYILFIIFFFASFGFVCLFSFMMCIRTHFIYFEWESLFLFKRCIITFSWWELSWITSNRQEDP